MTFLTVCLVCALAAFVYLLQCADKVIATQRRTIDVQAETIRTLQASNQRWRDLWASRDGYGNAPTYIDGEARVIN